jgi:neurofibromin 1
MQKQIWQLLASGHDTLTDLVVKELLSTAVDAGLGSEKAECAADILVSLASTAVRGRVIAKLRKVRS